MADETDDERYVRLKRETAAGIAALREHHAANPPEPRPPAELNPESTGPERLPIEPPTRDDLKEMIDTVRWIVSDDAEAADETRRIAQGQIADIAHDAVVRAASANPPGPPPFSPSPASPSYEEFGKTIPDDLETPLAAMVDEPEQDANQIPDELLGILQANPDEGPTEYRGRLTKLLHRFGMEDGTHFPGYEPLNASEKILVGRLLMVGAKSRQWAGL